MKKVTVLILIAGLLISGCHLDEERTEASDSSIDESLFTTDSVITSTSIDVEPNETSVVTETVINEETAETSLPDSFDLVPMDLNYDFEEIMNICSDYVGLDISQYSDEVINTIDVNDHHIQYIPDYGEHLDYLIRISPEGAADDLPECDYHILSSLTVDGVCIYEFDDAYWAGDSYGRFVENAVSNNIETTDSSYSNGYCFTYFVYIQDFRRFAVCYYFGRYTATFVYDVTVDNRYEPSDQYEKYIVLCNSLRLPTSDQITSIVLHD